MPSSPIEILDGAFTLKIEYGDANQLPSITEIEAEIVSIWLPIFRSRHNLALALEALRTTYPGEPMADLCAYYLQAVEVPDEDQ